MRRILTALSASAVFLVAVAAQTPEKVDFSTIAKIREEGLRHSQAAETLFWLADAGGPRLTGSPAYEATGDWVVKQLQTWGVANARKERFAFGRGWSLKAFHATMTAPQVMPIIGVPKAWTMGTHGAVTAEVVRVSIANQNDAAQYKGKLAGKIVLAEPQRDVHMLDRGDGTVLHYSDQNGKWRREAMTPNSPAPAQAPDAPRDQNAFSVNQFLKNEGVVALFDRGDDSDLAAGGSNLSWRQQHTDGGTVFADAGGEPTDAPDVNLPQVTLAVEHYNRMVRLIDHHVPVKVDLNIEVAFNPEPAGGGGFNIVGDIPGTDLKDQVVVIGAHFDSWQGGDGATDNATGCTAMLEAIRIIQKLGLHPRRTIRIALWGGEEQDELGSLAYVRDHLGTRHDPKPELAKTSAYFNLDNGTGRIRGVWMQGNPAVAPIFTAWAGPLKDLGVDLLSPRSVQQTDHESFDAIGVPGFEFVQERLEYNARTHHSNMDLVDHVQLEDLEQQGTVAAVFAWQAATRDEPLPRKR